MRTENITETFYNLLQEKAKSGSWSGAAVTLLTPNMNQVEKAQDAEYLVIESPYELIAFRLNTAGAPIARLIPTWDT